MFKKSFKSKLIIPVVIILSLLILILTVVSSLRFSSFDNDLISDRLVGQQNVKDALAGKTSTYFEEGSEIKVCVRTGSPIYDTDGTLLGVISAGVQFDTDAFVDNLKKV